MRNMSYEEYCDAVCALVHSRIGHLSWFAGVCTNSIKGSYRSHETIEDAVSSAELETALWDRPGGLFGDCGDGLGLRDADGEEL